MRAGCALPVPVERIADRCFGLLVPDVDGLARPSVAVTTESPAAVRPRRQSRLTLGEPAPALAEPRSHPPGHRAATGEARPGGADPDGATSALLATERARTAAASRACAWPWPRRRSGFGSGPSRRVSWSRSAASPGRPAT